MPQIWATYDELGQHFGKSSSETRQAVIEAGWPRRQCSDGKTRVKLTPTLGAELTRGLSQSAAPAKRADPASPQLAQLQAELEHARSLLNGALADLAAERERTATLMSEVLRLTVQAGERARSSDRRVA